MHKSEDELDDLIPVRTAVKFGIIGFLGLFVIGLGFKNLYTKLFVIDCLK